MNVQAFLEVLPLAGEGMLGVFATIIGDGLRDALDPRMKN